MIRYLQYFAVVPRDQKARWRGIISYFGWWEQSSSFSVGVFNLCFDSRVLILEAYLYIPNVCRNLIFVTYLVRHGYCVILKDNVVIKMDKMFICSGNNVDGLYIITPDKHELYNSHL